jgi:hypothetical protein
MEEPKPTFGEAKAFIREKRTFNIPVSGVPDIKATETVTISPHELAFTFERCYTDGDPKPPWDTPWPRVHGKRRLRNGSLSENSTHERQFYLSRTLREDVPQWVIDQVEKYRPED